MGTSQQRLPALDDLRMYLIMADRFDDADPSNNNSNGRSDNRNPLAVQGGDIKGIERRLPYLQSLGINAIWITPVQMNTPGAFHGYWIQHFKRVDPRLGTRKDLRSLVRQAHKRGMRVYLDVVCNHTGPLIGTVEGGHAWSDSGYTLAWKDGTKLPTPSALQDLSLYHNFGEVKEWTDPYQILGELPGGLDDLRTEDPRVLAIMIDIWTWWMEQSGCDGFRVDTVKHVDMAFWYAWLAAMRRHAEEIGMKDFFIFGEVFSGDDKICAPFTRTDQRGRRGFDAVFNFSIAEAVRDVFARGASIRRITASIENLPLYQTETRGRLLTFIDNHDMSRFLAVAEGDQGKLREALTFLYGLEGIPLVYYGTEQAFRGGTGPDWENRESMFVHGWKGTAPDGTAFDTSTSMYKHLSRLNAERARQPILRMGSCDVAFADTARQFLVLRRSLGALRAWVLYNGSDRDQVWSVHGSPIGRLWPADAGEIIATRRVRLHPHRTAWLLPERMQP
ncbi:MAG: alpha-amylase family glycosyl hydrolase [Bacteroidota bacterium]